MVQALTIKSVAEIPDRIAPGTQFIIDVFPGPDKEDQTITEEMLQLESEIYSEIDRRFNAKSVEQLQVEFVDGYVHITSVNAAKATIGGDVTDREISIDAGKTKKYKLTSEGNGYVTVNDQKFSY